MKSRFSAKRMKYIHEKIKTNKYPNVPELASDLEVSDRTIFRDIEYMRDQLGVAIDYDACKNGYYYTEDRQVLLERYLDEHEIMALMIGEKILKQYRTAPYFQEIQKIFHKILDHFPSPIKSPLFSFAQRPSPPAQQRKIRDLEKAAREKKQIEILYHAYSKNQKKKRLIDPYSVHNHSGNWYLIAFCHLRKDMRTLLINRIEKYKVTENHFKKKKDFSLKNYLSESFDLERGSESKLVRLYFSAYQANWIRERVWHGTQEIEEQENGSLIFSMKVKGLDEIKRWVMYYGSEVEVLEPKELKEAVYAEIKKMASIYSKKS